MIQRVARHFPKLVEGGFVQTSAEDARYNCVAFSLGDLTRWWWPPVYGPALDSYWPAGAPPHETLDAFIAMYRHFHFELASSASLEPGIVKVAIFVEPQEDLPAHVALQQRSGRWASKMWTEEDIMHDLESIQRPPNHFRAAAFVQCRLDDASQGLRGVLDRFG